MSAVSGIESLLEYLEQYAKVPSEAALPVQGEALNPPLEDPPGISGNDEDLEGLPIAAPNRPLSTVSPIDTKRADFVVPTAHEINEQAQVEHASDHMQSRNPDHMQLLILEIHKLLQSVKDHESITLPDAHLLQFIDCGGQLAYHDILPIFVNIPAIYLHVFNLTMKLTECPEDHICHEDGTKGFSARSPLTIVQMMARSVLAIGDLACKKLQLPEEVKATGSRKPCVAFIGTHYDKFFAEYGDQTDRELNDISSKLQESVPKLPLTFLKHKRNELPAMFFPVNNYAEKPNTGRDASISSLSTNCLKKEIKKEVAGVKVKVPVKWYIYQLMQWGMQKRKEQTYGDLCKSCASVGLTDRGDIYAMVTYFHALGLLIHHCKFEGKKHIEDAEDCGCLVFTDPSHLFENITKLYQVQFWRDGDVHGCLLDLKRSGKLTKEALTELNVNIDHKRFMDILVQLFIGADIKSDEAASTESLDENRTLFVPSVLTCSTGEGGTSGNGIRPLKQAVCFAITFKPRLHDNDTYYIPCGVFTGLIARLQSQMEWEMYPHSISRLHVEFQVGPLGTVKLYDHATHVGIAVESENVEEEDVRKYCNTVINATAEAYCFLFHSTSNTTKQPQSEACGDCSTSPYLILGQTCQMCPAPNALHFAELKVKKHKPMSVRCRMNRPKILVGTECVPFQHIFHLVSYTEEQLYIHAHIFPFFNIDYSLPPQAVVEKQRTHPAQTEKTEKDLSLCPPYPS